MQVSEKICGTIEKIIYKSHENGFAVATLKLNAKEQAIVTGHFSDIQPGQNVTCEGTWGFHQKFGRQFQVTNVETTLPSSASGIQKYLGSGLIKGIGPKYAEKLVSHFKEKTLEIIDKEPQRLYQVDGIGQKRVDIIVQAWQTQKEISRIMVVLHGHDISTAFAVKIYKKYGKDSCSVIQENPYRLAEEIWGVGFKTADDLALKLGFEPHCLPRIKAAILFSLSQVLEQGDLYLEVEALKKKVQELLILDNGHQALIKNALRELYSQDKIKLISKDAVHFITLPQYYFSEKGIAQKIAMLQTYEGLLSRFDLDKVYGMVSKPDTRGIMLNEDQQKGILSCIHNKISIITGGPGTGKTTLVKKLLEVLDSHQVTFRLAAPTGRAAKRMFEGTGRSAETLHRLLEFSPGVMNFTRNEKNALEANFFVIDEASMIDVFLMHALLRALPFHAHIVFLGDIDQLPSVGAGNVLNDLIASEKINVVRLTHIFRQAQDSLIIVNAHNVNSGKFPVTQVPGSRNDFVFLKQDEPEQMFAVLRELYQKKLPLLGIDVNDAMVLSPMHRGVAGTQRINQELQMILNPLVDSKPQVSRFGQIYATGDRVMQIRNNYTKFVFNGDIGVIKEINTVDQNIKIFFGDRELEYDFAELDELTLAYAISIHKSQGSEFQAVIIPIFMQHFILLQRNLIYTAITRAKKMCVLLGQTKAIAMGIKNNKIEARKTFLQEFLTSDLSAR